MQIFSNQLDVISSFCQQWQRMMKMTSGFVYPLDCQIFIWKSISHVNNLIQTIVHTHHYNDSMKRDVGILVSVYKSHMSSYYWSLFGIKYTVQLIFKGMYNTMGMRKQDTEKNVRHILKHSITDGYIESIANRVCYI